GSGRLLPHEMLHQFHLSDPEPRELFRPIGLHLLAMSRETPTITIPRLLFGLPLARGQRLIAGAMLANRSEMAYRRVHVRLVLRYVPGGRPWPLYHTYPWAIDVQYPLGRPPTGSKAFDLPPGHTERFWEGSPAIPGQPRRRHGGGGRLVRARPRGGVAGGRYAGFVVPAGPGGHYPLRQRGDDGGHDDGAPRRSLKQLAETGVAWITLAGRPPDVCSAVPGMQWGRLQVDVNCALRRGAWYRVARLASLEAILDVNRRPLKVPHYLVQVVSRPPTRWPVVPRPAGAGELPAEWGPQYGVCPRCRERAALHGRPRRLECTRCRGEFDFAWDEEYLADY